jgi:hypothetical protein
MKKHLSKKRVVLTTIVAVALTIASGVAYAYFTATGAGTGTAGVGNATAIVLTPTITGSLVPGGTPATVSIVVKNNGGGAQRVGTITLASITPDALHPTCVTTLGAAPANAFTMADVSVATTLAPSGGTVTKTGSLQMNDTGVSQDACQGATLSLSLTSN